MDMEYDIRINWCMLSDCAPSWSWKTDKNGFEDYDIWAVFRGKGSIFVDGKEFTVERGTCMLLPPKSSIFAHHDEDDPLLVMSAHFDFMKNGAVCHPFPLQQRFIDDVPLFEKLFDRVITCNYSDRTFASNAWLTSVLNEFFSSEGMTEGDPGSSRHMQCIREMCAAINEAKEDISLHGFAEKYGYSSAYLGKIFHRIMGVSFSKYVMSSRINRAKQLLSTSQKSVADIAEELHYCDVCFFIKQFKSIAGVSPGAYRKNSFKPLM